MINLLLLIFVSCSYSLILPPGYVLRKFEGTRYDVNSIKITERVIYGKDKLIFRETLWFKNPDRFRVYVKKNGDAILFIRNSRDCVAITSSRRIVAKDLCGDTRKNYYYNILLPYGSYVNYLKSLKIETRESLKELKNVKLKNEEGENTKEDYVKPGGIFLMRHGKTPIYVIGIDEVTYGRSLKRYKGQKSKDLGEKLLDSIKEKAPQVWIEKSTFYPLRVFGHFPQWGSEEFNLMLSSYATDVNKFPFPRSIELLKDEENKVSYSVEYFETNINLNDQLFDLGRYRRKFSRTINESNLKETKQNLLNYLKKLR